MFMDQRLQDLSPGLLRNYVMKQCFSFLIIVSTFLFFPTFLQFFKTHFSRLNLCLDTFPTLLVITFRDQSIWLLDLKIKKKKRKYSLDHFAFNNLFIHYTLQVICHSVHFHLYPCFFPPVMTFLISLPLTHVMCPSFWPLLLCTWVTCEGMSGWSRPNN